MKYNHLLLIGLLVLLLAACNPAESSPLAIAAASATHTPAPTHTATSTPLPPSHTPTSAQTPTPAPSSTPSIWEERPCPAGSNVMSVLANYWIWVYTGDVEGGGEVDMLLEFAEGNQVLGFYFDYERAQEYRVSGCVEGRALTLWLYQGDSVDAVIQGEFPATDPRDPASSEHTYDVIVGSWMENGSAESSAVYLHLARGSSGTMMHRFGRADDDAIINASQQFLAAIASDDRAKVVEMISFPVEYTRDGEEYLSIETPEAFLAQYDTIFDAAFKGRLAVTFPNYLLKNAVFSPGPIGLTIYGGGGIDFDSQGKVVAIHDGEKQALTSTLATSNTPRPEPTISPLCGSATLGTPGSQELNGNDAPPILIQGTFIICFDSLSIFTEDYSTVVPFRRAMFDLDSGIVDVDLSDIVYLVSGSGHFSSLWPVNGARAEEWSFYVDDGEVKYPHQPTYHECRYLYMEPISSDEEPAYMCVVTNEGHVARLKVEAFDPVPSIESLEISFVTWSEVIDQP